MSGAGCSSDSQTAGNAASCSSDVPGRIASSLRSTLPVGSPCSFLSGTGKSSRAKNPESTLAAARRWLSSAKASMSSRVTPKRSAST